MATTACKIERIYVACYKNDFWQTKICIASIRKWYPDIEIFLIKDHLNGTLNSKELEMTCNVKISDYSIDRFGWGVSKIEPYFEKDKRKFLILDSDIVFIGPVVEYLNQFNQPFVVSAEYFDDYKNPDIKRTYYDIDKIREMFDSDFNYPGYVFNSGQIVGTSGILDRNDFEPFIKWGDPPTLRLPHILSNADQGILNYLFAKKEQNREFEIGKGHFMLWGYNREVNNLNLDKIVNGNGYPKLIHWAGNIHKFNSMKGQDIIIYYQKLYYNGVRFGSLKRLIENKKVEFRKIRIRIEHRLKKQFKLKR